MKQRGGCLWLLVGLFLAILAGGLAFTAMLRATSAETAAEPEARAPVVVVARDVPPRTEVAAEDLIVKELPLSAVPENAVREQDQAVGKVTTSQLIPGEILLEPRVAEPGQQGTQINFEVEHGQVVMAFPATDLMSKTGVLRDGDIIDFLYTVDVQPTAEETEAQQTSGTTEEGNSVTFWGLQQVPITAVVLSGQEEGEEGKPQSYLLGLKPQEALILKHLKDTGAIVDIVIRAPEDQEEFEPEPVDPDYIYEGFELMPEQP